MGVSGKMLDWNGSGKKKLWLIKQKTEKKQT